MSILADLLVASITLDRESLEYNTIDGRASTRGVKMARRTTKVWLGLGVIGTLSAGAPSVAPAQHKGHGAAPPATQQKQAEEHGKGAAAGPKLAAPQGGEAYLTDGGPKDTRIRIYRDIGLMRGHLLVAAELIDQGLWDEALPHVLHPTEELYGAMERYIKLHKVTPFDRQLKALAQAVKAKNKPAYLQARMVVDERISAALEVFKKFMRDKPFTSFTSQTIVELLKVAQLEYEASIENGVFAKPVEYQDSRGFVWHAEQILEAHRTAFVSVDKTRYDELRSIVTELKAAWPSAVPPAKPVVEPAIIAASVERFARAAECFYCERSRGCA
jgi:hypothetical protein